MSLKINIGKGLLLCAGYLIITSTGFAADTWTTCANEGSTCSFSGTQQVRYGANNSYAYKTATGSISCNNAVFGDPVYGIVKQCSVLIPSSSPNPVPSPPIVSPTPVISPIPTAWTNCASEGGTCRFTDTRQVRYGANNTYVYKTATGSIGCNNALFGDPIVGVVKACSYAAAAPTPVVNPPPAPTPIVTPPPLVRSMWVWNDDDIGTTALQNTLIEFAVSRKINVVSIHAPGLLLNRPTILADFINRAAARQVKVELLFGDPNWMFTANHQQALEQLTRANNFTRSLTGAKPIGVHFDIEPHALGTWDANRVSYSTQLINLYEKMQAAKLPGLQLNVDMAMSYREVLINRNGVSKSLSHWLVDTVDRTTLMSYRDYAFGPDSIIFHSNHPVDYAATKGKQVMVSVETTCGLIPEKVSFCEEGLTEMNAAIDSVYSNYKTNTGFGGMSLHDYRGLRQLQ